MWIVPPQPPRRRDASLDPKATPSLGPSVDPDVITGAGGGGAPPKAVPGMTLNLNIDLAVHVEKGQAAVSSTTVVYAPPRSSSPAMSTSCSGSTA